MSAAPFWGLGEFLSFGRCHPLPPGTKVLLGMREEKQGPAESAGDPDKRNRQPPPLRWLA